MASRAWVRAPVKPAQPRVPQVHTLRDQHHARQRAGTAGATAASADDAGAAAAQSRTLPSRHASTFEASNHLIHERKSHAPSSMSAYQAGCMRAILLEVSASPVNSQSLMPAHPV